MPIQILMPALSPTMTEGNLVKWHKKEGDTVKSGQLLAEIETDKATMEVEAVDEGILGKILVPEGSEEVKVNTLIGLILEEGEDISVLENFKSPVQEDTTSHNEGSKEQPNQSGSASSSSSNLNVTQHGNSERVFASPLARRIAEQKQVDIRQIQGSGPRGRIIKADVEIYTASSPQTSNIIENTGFNAGTEGTFTDLPLSSMRKTIAKRLTESKQEIPHFYLAVECNLDRLLALRSELNNLPHAVKLSVNDLVLKACALALKAVPEANVTYHGSYVRRYDDVDVAVAVAIEGGLLTPVVRNADKKSLKQISVEMKSLAERAKAGQLKPHEYQGGAFSLSNLGMFGVQNFCAIINPPQASILAVGAGEKKPIVTSEGAISIATLVTCTLSVDHRALDGAVGAQFLSAIKQHIEHPLLLVG